MHGPTLTWWSVLIGIALVNIAGWAWSLRLLRPRLAAARGFDREFLRLQLLLSAGYVAGCAWRSALPVFDVPRLVLVDSWASSVLVGRSVATVAELCFAAQWALLLRAIAQGTGSLVARRAAGVLVPLIAVAECFSWHAVLTTANLGHVIEESLWGVSASLVVLALLHAAPSLQGRQRLFAQACAAAGAGYAAYMFGVDVPMYWERWLADETQGRVYLDVVAGLADASSRWVVSHDWAHWRGEVLWMSIYFSVAVWVSIGLAHAPLRLRELRASA